MPGTGRNGSCLPCATGYFTSDLGNIACDQCDPGTFANVTGSSQCTACLPGGLQLQRGCLASKAFLAVRRCISVTLAHHLCPCDHSIVMQLRPPLRPAGTFNPNPAGNSALSCRAAPKGSYVPSAGSDEALPCPVGTYANVTGLTQCKVSGQGQCLLPGGVEGWQECLPERRGLPNGQWTDSDRPPSCSRCTPCSPAPLAPTVLPARPPQSSARRATWRAPRPAPALHAPPAPTR